MHLVGNLLCSDVFEPLVVDIHALDHLRLDSKTEFFQLVCKLISVDQINGWGTITCGLSHCVTRKRSRGDEEAFVGSADEGSPKISDVSGGDRALILLALKQNMETEKTADLDNSFSVNTAVTGFSGDLDLHKS